MSLRNSTVQFLKILFVNKSPVEANSNIKSSNNAAISLVLDQNETRSSVDIAISFIHNWIIWKILLLSVCRFSDVLCKSEESDSNCINQQMIYAVNCRIHDARSTYLLHLSQTACSWLPTQITVSVQFWRVTEVMFWPTISSKHMTSNMTARRCFTSSEFLHAWLVWSNTVCVRVCLTKVSTV